MRPPLMEMRPPLIFQQRERKTYQNMEQSLGHDYLDSESWAGSGETLPEQFQTNSGREKECW